MNRLVNNHDDLENMQNSNQNIVVMKRKMKERRDGRRREGEKRGNKEKRRNEISFKIRVITLSMLCADVKKVRLNAAESSYIPSRAFNVYFRDARLSISSFIMDIRPMSNAGMLARCDSAAMLQTIDKIKCFNIIIGYRIFNNTINAPKFQHNFYGSHGGLCYCTSDI